MLHLLLGRLRWPPDAVWRATPREIAAALAPGFRAAPAMGRSELRELMHRFPDR